MWQFLIGVKRRGVERHGPTLVTLAESPSGVVRDWTPIPFEVEPKGFEPSTSALRTQRSPS